MTLTRRNAHKDGGTFKNSDLLWYAKAVGVMKSRPVNDPTSWWFYAAMHGQKLNKKQEGYPDWTFIESIPASANLGVLPSATQMSLYWDQCQHSTGFFLPWHRGYLAALEYLLRDIIINQLNGPADWALPYWNYFNKDENKIPTAFTDSTLPNTDIPNPLYVAERYGPDKNGIDIYVDLSLANQECQSKSTTNDYLGKSGGFNHIGSQLGSTTGRIESNPHNRGHIDIGKYNEAGKEGLMSDETTAALDPIFYIHHCNIDRMWAAWNTKNNNPKDTNWLEGPTADGLSRYAMPMDGAGTAWHFAPKDVNSTNINFYGNVGHSYTYDDLTLPVEAPSSLASRLINLGKLMPEMSENEPVVPKDISSELVGASTPLTLFSGITETSVQIDNTSWKSVANSLRDASNQNLPDEVYLQLENVKGIHNSNSLLVSVNGTFVDSIALFGLRSASEENSQHGGTGLTFNIDITHVIDELYLSENLNIDALKVKIETSDPIIGDTFEVGRISVYRVAQ